MNKLFTRIMATVAGFAMAIGVGIGVGSQRAKAIYADDFVYSFTIDAGDFNTTSYAANNNEKTSEAVCTTDNTKTMDVKWTSNQVMKNGSNMQWQKSKGYIYNSTDLGTINSVTVNSSAGTFTTHYGTEEQPSSGSSGSGKGFFKTSVGGATGTTSSIVITFTISSGSEQSSPLSSIALSGTYPTTFTQGDEFSHDGMTVTATYEDASTANVTSKATFSGYNMNQTGNQTVTVSYTENQVTKTASYGITINVATYSVTYNSNGATSGNVPVDNNEYPSGTQVTVLGNTGNLAKDGYSFGGWQNGNNTYQEGNTFQITANTTLTAVWNEVIEEGTDVLNREFTGVSGTSYTDWSGKTGTASGAVYAGHSAGSNDSIQLRSNDNSSGIISTTSGGNVKKVTVVWESHTSSSRKLNIYGKDTAYSSTADLYSNNENTQGELIGSIIYGTSTSLTINGSYRYVGLRSDDGAMYLTSIKIKWEEAQLNPRVTLSSTSINLKTNQPEGLTVTAQVEDVTNPTYSWEADNDNVTLVNANAATVTIKPEQAGQSVVTLTVGGADNLTATVNVTISEPEPGETAGTPFSISQAKAHVDAVIENDEIADGNDGNKYYITGIISSFYSNSVNSKGQISYYISADGTTSGVQFEAFKGLGLDGEKFNSIDDIQVGDTVVIFGYLKLYNTTYELGEDNYIVRLTPAPRVNSITLTPATVTVETEAIGNVADLFTSIVINQDEGSNKDLSDISWSSDDENIFYVENGQYLAGDEHRSSTTIRALIDGKEYGHATINLIDPNAREITYNSTAWREVDNPSTLAPGDKVILTGITESVTYAAATYVSGNNVKADSENLLTISNGVATGVKDTMIYTLEEGTADGSVAFKDSEGKYLYAASSGSNQLKSQDTIDNNASFIIGSDSSVVAQGSNTRNRMRYNTSSKLFACYGDDNTGTVVKFYKLASGTDTLELLTISSVKSAYEDENGAYVRLGAELSESEWNAMDSAFGISGYGVMLLRETTLEGAGFSSIESVYRSDDENKPNLKDLRKASNSAPADFYVAAKINIKSESDRSVTFCAAAYVISESGDIYFLNEVRGSLVDLLP